MKVKYNYDSEFGVSACTICKHGRLFTGYAYCHPDDIDMQSEYTGGTIAYTKACIMLLKYEKNCVLKPQYNAIKQLYYSMNKSKQYNPNSYEARRIIRHMKMYQADIASIQKELKASQEYLKKYIDDKEKIYARIRKGQK